MLEGQSSESAIEVVEEVVSGAVLRSRARTCLNSPIAILVLGDGSGEVLQHIVTPRFGDLA